MFGTCCLRYLRSSRGILRDMAGNHKKGDVVRLRTGESCLITEILMVKGIGTFYEVLLPDGDQLLIDESDIVVKL